MSKRNSSLLLVLSLLFGAILSVLASSQTVANANQATAEVTAATSEPTIATLEPTTTTPEPTTVTVEATTEIVQATTTATSAVTEVTKPAETKTVNPPVSIWAGQYRVKASVPYLWVRFDASTTAGIFTTIYPGTVVNAVAAPSGTGLVWDGIQWWGRIQLPTTGITGFVEYGSVEPVGTATTPTFTPIPSSNAAEWQPTNIVHVKLTVPYAWLRSVPSSFGAVLYQTSAGANLSIQDKAQSDGTQWWWPVRDITSSVVGWVEQNSLELIGGVATATPTPIVTGTPSGAAANWQPTNIVRVKLTIPFVWLRSVPSSFGTVLYQESTGILLTIQDKAQSDGTQWWWPVRDTVSNVVGWVEQNSLDLVTGSGVITPTAIGPQPTATIVSWNVSTKVRVRLSIPYSWLRSNANSYASVNFTAPAGTVLEVLGGPQTDTTQWWWLVKISGTNSSGWVEQNSLELAP
ncbi:MAG: hypothetical protein ABI947_29330 [Chloroflexota bacterium]